MEKKEKQENPKVPPVQKVPEKEEVPPKPKPEKNPSGGRDNLPEQQSGG